MKEYSLKIQARLSDIAFATPSRFTHYCRQYLGENYFDTLSDSEEELAASAEERLDSEIEPPAYELAPSVPGQCGAHELGGHAGDDML